ncbi:MAG: NAD(P)-binding domain-containing protein [Chloroflexota bacterium]
MKKIGFVGLGLMGKPMAHTLLKAGYPVTLYDLREAPMAELAADGAIPADSPKAVAAQADIVFISLPDSPDVERVVLGPNGIMEGGQPGLIVIDLSTISPGVAANIADGLQQQGMHWLDAPVSGSVTGAAEGTLSIMVGGDEAVFQDCLELLQVLGKTIVHVGGPGMGQVTKACSQIMTATTLAAMGEALVLAAKAGADVDKVVEAMQGGAANCWALQVRAPDILDGDLSPKFKAHMHHKDLGIVMEASKTYQVPLPISSTVRELYGSMLATERGDLDTSAIFTVIEDLANFKGLSGRDSS